MTTKTALLAVLTAATTLTAAASNEITLDPSTTHVSPILDLTPAQAAYQTARNAVDGYLQVAEQAARQTTRGPDGESTTLTAIVNKEGKKLGTAATTGNKTVMRNTEGKFVATIVTNLDGTRTMYDESGNALSPGKAAEQGQPPKPTGKQTH